MKYHKVALGGTFDCFHRGHEMLIKKAFELGEHVVVGVTSDGFAKKSHIRRIRLIRRISRIGDRRKAVEQFIEEHGWQDRCEIIEIADHYGPTVDDPTFDVIVVSPETEKFAVEINKKRATKGYKPLVITVVPWVLADDNKLIAATRIRNGEIGADGEVFALPANWGVRRLPDEIRRELRKPFDYAQGKPFGTFYGHISLISRIRPIRLISVGDKVTHALLHEGITPAVAVIDYHIRRKREYTHFTEHGFDRDVAVTEVKNPAGTVSYASFAAIRRIAAHAYTSYESYKTYKSYVLIVDGEEDLLVLPAILAAPLGTLVVYGQPPIDDQKEGIVVVEVTVGKKREVMRILSQFQIID